MCNALLNSIRLRRIDRAVSSEGAGVRALELVRRFLIWGTCGPGKESP